jgi:hypothetical protein
VAESPATKPLASPDRSGKGSCAYVTLSSGLRNILTVGLCDRVVVDAWVLWATHWDIVIDYDQIAEAHVPV